MASIIATNNIAQKGSPAMQIDLLSQERYVKDSFDGKAAMVKQSQSYQVPSIHTQEFVQPQTTVLSNAFVNPTQFEFHWPRRGARRLKNAAIRLRVQETGGSAAVVVNPTPFWFQRIEVRTKGGSNLVQTLYPWSIWYATAFIPVSRWTTLAPLMASSASWGNGNSLAASTTREYYLPLLGSFFDSEIDLEAFNDDVVVRCYTQSAVQSGTGVLAVVSGGIELLADETTPDERSDKIMKQVYANNAQIQQFWDTTLIQGSATFTAGQATKISLQQVLGKVPFIMFGVRSSDGAGSAAYLTYTALEDSNRTSGAIDFLDPGSKSLIGGSTLWAAQLRYLEFCKQCNSQFALNNAVYLLPFCKNADQTFADATLANGSFAFDGQLFQLSITPSASFSTGQYYYDIICFVAKRTAVDTRGMASEVRNA